ncbi:MAG: DUF4384 domain-containing protein [Leptospiraceae bacterium]|nr:DUF4384 domain-containing protein [Leptospiraceae bacterium]MCP5495953.1 DUF4384 domain-containing protein [Leptospiraceae bacterium]
MRDWDIWKFLQKANLFLLPFVFLSPLKLHSQEFDVQIKTNKPQYQINEPVYIKVKVTQKSYLYILTLQSNGNLLLLFPNEDDKENFFAKGLYQVPTINSKYEFLAHEPKGTDTFIAVVSKKKIARLHKRTYWQKPITKKPIPNLADYRWLKKLTKNLMPDEWDYSETSVTIVSHGNYGERRIKSNPPDTAKDFENSVVMNGSFTIPQIAREGENKHGTFIIYKKPSKDTRKYKLRIAPYTGISSCEYDVKSFSAPNQATDLYGIINVEPSICKLEGYDSKYNDFWRSVSGVYLRYKYDKFGKLDGNIWFIVERKYNEKLNNVNVKGNFNFLLEDSSNYRYESLKDKKKDSFDKYHTPGEFNADELEYIDSDEE